MKIHTETKGKKYSQNLLQWLIIIAVIITYSIGIYLYKNISFILKLFALLITILIVCVVVLMTEQGKIFLKFIIEARNEIRKIIWPTSQETFYTTLIIAATTILMSLIIWGLDIILVNIVSLITSLRF